MRYVRRGAGKPLLLIHGLGGSWHEWQPVLGRLAAEREVIIPDLPGFGETPPLPGEVSIRTLADAVTAFMVPAAPGRTPELKTRAFRPLSWRSYRRPCHKGELCLCAHGPSCGRQCGY